MQSCYTKSLYIAKLFKDLVGFDFDKNPPMLFDNGMDKYEGVWQSDFICSSSFVNDNDLNPEVSNFYREVSRLVKEYNFNITHGYKIVGVELNKFTDCTVYPHVDNANFDNRRIRVIVPITGSSDYRITIGSKTYESFSEVEMDCTKEHSFENKGTVYFLIVDLVPFDVTPKEEVGYLLKPMLYYMNLYKYMPVSQDTLKDKHRSLKASMKNDEDEGDWW